MHTLSISQRLAKQLKIKRWMIHVIYWFAWISFWAFMWGTFDNNYYKTVYIQILELPFKLAMVYPVIHFLMPRYLLKTNYIHFGLLYIILLFITGGAMKIMWYHCIDPIYFADRLVYGPLKITELLNVMLSVNTAVILPVGIKLTENWMFHQHKSSELEREKLQAELKFLRTQVNPHFLFNALNSVYALSLKQSELTTQTIAQLADIMRYVIYEASESFVDFSKEIAFIKNYIAFEKVRVDNDVEISFSVNSSKRGQIPPLLILPLIENAFKHLKGTDADTPWIVIQIEANDNGLKVFVENSINPEFMQKEAKGIGLENLKKRLEILYPDNHKIVLEKNEYSFKSILTINNLP